MSTVFHRNPHATYPIAYKGDGVYIIDNMGNKYLDACGGAAVSCLGHSHPAIIKAIKDQLNQIPYAHSSFFTTKAMEKLADNLIEKAPGELSRAYFVSGGSEAMEAALKLARQYYVEQGQTSRKYFIARKQSYHGNTLGALAAGGNAWRREQFKPLLVEFAHIDPCYAYRYKNDQESEQDYSKRSANELTLMIDKLGKENVIGFICEPVIGATSGAVPATNDYLKEIRKICNDNDILLIFDEVMCGMGRCGYTFTHEQDEVECDIVTIAKGLGAGYQPIGAMLASEKIYQCIYQGSGFFQHGHTYMGHATACAAALAVQNTIEEHQLLTKVIQSGEYLKSSLQTEFTNHPYVGDIRGRGLFLGMEFVKDKSNKTPFNAQIKLNVKIKATAMANGLMCYPMGGTIDGINGDHLLLAPPFIISESQLDEIVDKLKQSLHQVFKQIKS